ncbi:phosphopyruvate hydratase [Patescibacteria group bacterium]|nr:phosphopyruvate hydratase [Patescibacteria group bacterium]
MSTKISASGGPAAGGKRSIKIKDIYAREILDSRGDPTIEVKIELFGKIKSVASVPSGASIGGAEATELRDNDVKRYGGKGVLKAVENVNAIIAKILKGKNAARQKEIDAALIDLDGTENKSRLGANAILAVSLACAEAGAKAEEMPLYEYISKTYQIPPKDNPAGQANTKYQIPIPMFNIFNGGKHADTNLDIQEIMIVPIANVSFSEKVRYGAEIFHELKKVLSQHNLDTDIGNEGGYAPDIKSTAFAFDLILEAIKKAGFKLGKDIALAIDAGANSFYDAKENKYILKADGVSLSSDRLVSLYLEWINKYNLISIEDPLNEKDWEEWGGAYRRLKTAKGELMVVTDDLTATNLKRITRAIKETVGSAIIIKPNQVGTLSETMETVNAARKAGWKIVVSHRSGETCDSFIADLAVAVGADFIKAGSLSRGERLAKYNRLMEIESEIKLK